MNEKVQYWIDIAEYDLETARVMLETKRLLYVGFMCHQVIEKILKGYYAFLKDKIPPYTHNLKFLVEQTNLFEKLSEEHKETINMLGPMNIKARYPAYKEKLQHTLDYKRCEGMVHKTEELYQWIKKQLLNE